MQDSNEDDAPFCFPFGVGRHLVWVELTAVEIRRAVRTALAEDLGRGDATTLATVPKNARSVALMRAREPLVVAGNWILSRWHFRRFRRRS